MHKSRIKTWNLVKQLYILVFESALIFRHLKLEIALAILALNDEKSTPGKNVKGIASIGTYPAVLQHPLVTPHCTPFVQIRPWARPPYHK